MTKQEIIDRANDLAERADKLSEEEIKKELSLLICGVVPDGDIVSPFFPNLPTKEIGEIIEDDCWTKIINAITKFDKEEEDNG